MNIKTVEGWDVMMRESDRKDAAKAWSEGSSNWVYFPTVYLSMRKRGQLKSEKMTSAMMIGTRWV